MKKRIEWVDICKFICIMFVMLSHLESGTEVLRKFYSPFFLSVFFFLSGYVYRQPKSFKEHFLKKLKGLFVPWFIFSNFNIVLSSIISLKEERNLWSELAWNALQIRGEGDGVWFVAALFAAFIPFYFLIRWEKPRYAIGLSFVLSFISIVYERAMNPDFFPWRSVSLPWHMEYIPQALFWMVLGYYFKLFAEAWFDQNNTLKNRIVVWGVYLLIIFLPISGKWISIPVSYLKSGLAICAVIALCKVCKSHKYIKFVGENTLTYFALHGKVYAVLEAILEQFSVYKILLQNEIGSNILAITITFVMSLLLIIPAAIINKWFPWILGKKG